MFSGILSSIKYINSSLLNDFMIEISKLMFYNNFVRVK